MPSLRLVSPKELLRTLDGGDEFEAHGLGLGTEFGFLPLESGSPQEVRLNSVIC